MTLCHLVYLPGTTASISHASVRELQPLLPFDWLLLLLLLIFIIIIIIIIINVKVSR